MSSLERRRATNISILPTFQLASWTDCPTCCQKVCQWLLTILRPTLSRRGERCRSWIALSMFLWRPSSLSELFPSVVVACFLKFPVRIFLCPFAILKSRFSKSGVGLPVVDAEVMRSSIILASSTSPIHNIASLGYCEEWVTSLLKLICQLLNSVSWGHLSRVICSASLSFSVLQDQGLWL